MIDKKKALAEILSSLSESKKGEGYKPSSESSSVGGEEESEGDVGKESAADDIISAIRSGDATALAEALQAFVAMC